MLFLHKSTADQDCCCLSQLFLPLSTHLCTLSRVCCCSLPLSDYPALFCDQSFQRICVSYLQQTASFVASFKSCIDCCLILTSETRQSSFCKNFFHCIKKLAIYAFFVFAPDASAACSLLLSSCGSTGALRELLCRFQCVFRRIYFCLYCCCLPRFHLQLQELLRIYPCLMCNPLLSVLCTLQ